MALNGSVHINSRFCILLAPLTISTALSATATTPITQLGGMKYLVAEAIFLYGSGGTTTNAYIQTSLDGGLTWVDIINFSFTTSAASKIWATTADVAVAAVVTPSDGALTSNTIVQGVLGDRLRLKYVTTGTYAGATSLAVYAHAKG